MLRRMAGARPSGWIPLGLVGLGALLAWLALRPTGDPAPVAAAKATPLVRPTARSMPVTSTVSDNSIIKNKSTNQIAPALASAPAHPSRTLTPEGGPALLRSVMQDEVAPEIMRCVTEWHDEFPDASGEVIMGFTLGPEGLMDARIEESTELPVGLLSCVSAAVWEGDWPANPDGQLEVRYPITLEMGGSAP